MNINYAKFQKNEWTYLNGTLRSQQEYMYIF